MTDEQNRTYHKMDISSLGHTWIFDIDGTIVKHNGYLTDGRDTLLPGARDFFAGIPEEDVVILLTSRKEEYREVTEKFLHDNGIRYHYILYGMPYGERILVNDRKPSGLAMALAINTERDVFMKEQFAIDEQL